MIPREYIGAIVKHTQSHKDDISRQLWPADAPQLCLTEDTYKLTIFIFLLPHPEEIAEQLTSPVIANNICHDAPSLVDNINIDVSIVTETRYETRELRRTNN